MSQSAATAPAHEAHGHEAHGGFLSTYVFSLDHKTIGKQFLTLSLLMIIVGGLLALLVRWELAWPETAVPGMGWVPEPLMYDGIIPPETYNMMFTMHATIMIFFVVMPALVGCFGNFLIPLMIGARDMAFPVLNMLSFASTRDRISGSSASSSSVCRRSSARSTTSPPSSTCGRPG
jgi:cytochrome c oxidase subunit 1